MFNWGNLDKLDRLFVVWAFIFQFVLIVHFAVRKFAFQSYTVKFGWIVYALCIPTVVISIILLRGGKDWSFWLGGFIFLIYSAFGYWVDYVSQVPWRNPLKFPILFPYVILYLSTIMFYWWPLGRLSRTLWFAYAILFIIATFLNITSH